MPSILLIQFKLKSNIMANSSSERGFYLLCKSLWTANIPVKVAICMAIEDAMNCCLLEKGFVVEIIKVNLVAYYVLVLLNLWGMFYVNILL